MLTEIPSPRQVPNDFFRRWFTDETFDLIVWYSDAKSIVGFQLCYRLDRREKALTWMRDRGYNHANVDTGDAPAASRKRTPILLPDGAFDTQRIAKLFEASAAKIDGSLRALVIERISACPQSAHFYSDLASATHF